MVIRSSTPAVELDVDGRTVRLTNPDRVYFPAHGWTKLDLAQYYLAVGPGIVRALRERPCMMHRFPEGLAGPKVHQKRIPAGAPPWIETVRLHFPRFDRSADELCVTELGAVLWAVQMSTVEFHPWNVRRADVDRPDEWRIDLDPMPECDFDRVRRVAGVVREVLAELGIVGYPKTSGGNGLHVYVRIAPEWEFADVRRAALAFATEVCRRVPDDATVTWWRKDRDPRHVFIDYNQNARDHTIGIPARHPLGVGGRGRTWVRSTAGRRPCAERFVRRGRCGLGAQSGCSGRPCSGRPCSSAGARPGVGEIRRRRNCSGRAGNPG